MTATIKLDSTGDWDFSGATMHLVDDAAQRVTTRLRMLSGEWFLDLSDGTPYLDQVFPKGANLDLARSALIDRVKRTEGIAHVASVVFDPDAVRRRLNVTVTAIGPAGEFKVFG